jgi:hypothetical protein
MLYLLDANILITANSLYYPIDQVPEFWSWLQHQGASGRVKIPLEIWEEVREGRNDDPLINWLSEDEKLVALSLYESLDVTVVQRVVSTGYADNLTDDEVEKLGRDPFLIAYALSKPSERCVVTTEVSKPSAQRQNRKIPDVCQALGVQCCGPFVLNRNLRFHTGMASLAAVGRLDWLPAVEKANGR